MGISQDEYENLKRIIKEYGAALEECAAYFDDHSDVIDGPEGQPLPNKEMRMLQMIEGVL